MSETVNTAIDAFTVAWRAHTSTQLFGQGTRHDRSLCLPAPKLATDGRYPKAVDSLRRIAVPCLAGDLDRHDAAADGPQGKTGQFEGLDPEWDTDDREAAQQA